MANLEITRTLEQYGQRWSFDLEDFGEGMAEVETR